MELIGIVLIFGVIIYLLYYIVKYSGTKRLDRFKKRSVKYGKALLIYLLVTSALYFTGFTDSNPAQIMFTNLWFIPYVLGIFVLLRGTVEDLIFGFIFFIPVSAIMGGPQLLYEVNEVVQGLGTFLLVLYLAIFLFALLSCVRQIYQDKKDLSSSSSKY